MGEQTIIKEASRDQNVKKAQLPGDSRLGGLHSERERERERERESCSHRTHRKENSSEV